MHRKFQRFSAMEARNSPVIWVKYSNWLIEFSCKIAPEF